ncbi:4108_t:CDS:2 [Entrophospora sp. SA101]|nr:2537_t:CDS:2 [Entrophospora sp. SA101]CAJ0753441.1 18848_t:CDS:2 [Entrophospora sp. SA101]CAJ0763015.1 4108_t:CDS:2 [Entrophospora sp. SA101]CAJ0835540.1 13911_t:CDS:2 [Entrophospora sp. SA101]CAJ0908965.1 6217_t:CDS:2 [Entrophospora sp. SA101]
MCKTEGRGKKWHGNVGTAPEYWNDALLENVFRKCFFSDNSGKDAHGN